MVTLAAVNPLDCVPIVSRRVAKGGGGREKGGGAEAKNALDRQSSPGPGAPSLRSHRRGHWFESSSDHRIRQGIAGFFPSLMP